MAYTRISVEDTSFSVETDDADGDIDAVVRAGHGQTAVTAAAESFHDAMDRVRAISHTLITQVVGQPGGPDEVKAKFGVKIGGESGVVVVKGTAEAHFELELTWTRKTASDQDESV